MLGGTTARLRWARLALIAFLLFLLGRELPAWANPAARPPRQTVPRTPPPTWTPEVPLAAPTSPPTPPEPPQRPTPAPDETPLLAPEPWLGLSAEPLLLGPGSQVILRLRLENIGTASLAGARLVLPRPPVLHFTTVRLSTGQVSFGPPGLTWEPGPLESGAGQWLEITALLAEDVLPDGLIPLQATLTWPEGHLVSNALALTLPWALLPEAGEPAALTEHGAPAPNWIGGWPPIPPCTPRLVPVDTGRGGSIGGWPPSEPIGGWPLLPGW